MVENSAISEEMRSWLGVESEPKVLDVEKGHIRRFAEAVGDPNPLWQDQAYALKSRHGNIIAPPTFLQDYGLGNLMDNLLKVKCSLPRLLNGGSETECYKPMMPGDVITARAKLADLYEKQGKTGKLLFMVTESTFTNQRGELVAKARYNFIRY